MAEAIFNDLIQRRQACTWNVHASSVGTFAVMGAPMSDKAQKALEKQGIKTGKSHRSTPFTVEAAQKADLILAMQQAHLDEVLALAPMLKGRAHTLKGFAAHVDGTAGSDQYDIADPFGGSMEEYAQCAAEIRRAAQGVLARLEREWNEP